MKRLGTHLLLEMAGCPAGLLDDQEKIATALLEAARAAKTTVLGSSFHQFSPQGVSGVVVIAESHLSIHTWPELGYAAIDIFTCGDRAMPRAACEHLLQSFAPSHYQLRELERGLPQTAAEEAVGAAERWSWQPPTRQGWA